ncbi:hypothetical protein HJD18_04480 [Thermoleophilia bacterium SCSIO 60948]|nr:hypothetical protein HJD18_04480 [Thermoleophilia bacterium SCSIO 60948]
MLAAVAALALIGAGCGGDEPETTSTPTTTSTGATGLTGATGSTGDAGASDVASIDSASQLVECLDGEGLEAAEAGPVLGLEDYEVVDLSLGDSDQAAVFVILDSPEAAKKDVEEIGTLAGVAFPEARGNVVFGFDATADETPEDEAAVDACLPPGSGGGA